MKEACVPPDFIELGPLTITALGNIRRIIREPSEVAETRRYLREQSTAGGEEGAEAHDAVELYNWDETEIICEFKSGSVMPCFHGWETLRRQAIPSVQDCVPVASLLTEMGPDIMIPRADIALVTRRPQEVERILRRLKRAVARGDEESAQAHEILGAYDWAKADTVCQTTDGYLRLIIHPWRAIREQLGIPNVSAIVRSQKLQIYASDS